MSKMKRHLSLFLALVMVFSLVFCFTANTASETAFEPVTAKVNFMTMNRTVVGSKEYQITDENQIIKLEAADLKALCPAGYELMLDAVVTLDKDTLSQDVLVKAVAVEPEVKPDPEEKPEIDPNGTHMVAISFVTADGTSVGKSFRVAVKNSVTALVATDFVQYIPEGYELSKKADLSLSATDNAKEILVEAIETETAPIVKNVPVKFMTDGSNVVATTQVTVSNQGEPVVLRAADLAVLCPEGYELVENADVTVTFDTAEVRILVKSTKPAPIVKNVPVKFMTDGTTVVSTKYVTVSDQGEPVVLRAADLAVLCPEGYELVENADVTVTFETAEVRILVKSTKPAPIVKNVPVKFMTDGTTVVATEYVTVSDQGEPVELRAADLAVLCPEGYELMEEAGVTVTFDTKEVRILVKALKDAPIVKNVPVKFMIDGTTVVATKYVTVSDQGKPVELCAADLAVLCPEGYELVEEAGVTVTFETAEVRILVKSTKPAPIVKNVPVKFMTDGTTVVATKYVTVSDQGKPVELRAADLAVLCPEGYELMEEAGVTVSFNTKEVRILVKALKDAPIVKNVPVKFMTDGTTVVSTKYVTVSDQGKPVELRAADLAVLCPEGYELMEEAGVTVTFNTKEVRILVKAIKDAPIVKNVPVKFMTDGTTVVSTKYVTVSDQGKPVELRAADLAVLCPEGYELVEEAGVTVTFNTKEVRILVKALEVEPTSRLVRVDYVDADDVVIYSEDVVVEYGRLSMTVFAPKGYTLFDTNNVIAIDDTTKMVQVLVVKNAVEPENPEVPEVPETKIIYVNYNTADGKNVLTTNMTVPYEAKSVSASELKDVPYGYNLITKGEVVIDEYNAINVIVELKPVDTNKDDVPKTGDNSGIAVMSVLAATSLMGAAALTMKKKSEEK